MWRSLLLAAAAAILAGLLTAGAWVGLHLYRPEVPSTIYELLTRHPWATGLWLLLAVVGIDYSLATVRDTVGYRNVGQKSLAHYRLTKGGR